MRNTTPSKLSDSVLYLTSFPELNYNPNTKVSTNFTLGEYKEATKKTAQEWEQDISIPVEASVVEIVQYIRDVYGKALYLGSVYRSDAWDIAKGRTDDDGNATSQHTFARAADLNDKGKGDFRDWFINEVNNDTEFINTCRAMGMTAVGYYDWGIHFDIRPSNYPNKLIIWDDREKSSGVGVLKGMLNIILIGLGIYAVSK